MSTLVIGKEPKSAASEAYRTMRTNIQLSFLDKGLKSVLVTSPGAGEGKTSTAANLALTTSQVGKRVLLMDCDLRRPSIHKVFQIENVKGLTDLMLYDLKMEETVVKYSPRLDILTCGKVPYNPSEMLASRRIKSLLEDVSKNYDFVVIDSPPVIAVTDAQILSANVDGILLVVSSSVSPIEACGKAKNLLKSINGNIIGVVLNKVKRKRGGYYNYGDYYKDSPKHAVK